MTAEGPPSPPSDPPTRVVVAVLTYRRLPALTALLPKLVAECRSLDAAYGTASHVLVVDNDQQRAAQPVVAAAGEEVRYVHEPTPGIAAGRARAVEEAAQDDLLVFIDDDEIPGGRWLTHLWEAWNAYSRPAGVVGRVTPTFCGSVDPWIEAGAFFRRKQRRSGTLLAAGSSANLLLDLHVLRD